LKSSQKDIKTLEENNKKINKLDDKQGVNFIISDNLAILKEHI